MSDKLDVTAEARSGWRIEGAETAKANASPEVSQKVQAGLKDALQAQLATEVQGLGGFGDKITIHGRTGVSNDQIVASQPALKK